MIRDQPSILWRLRKDGKCVERVARLVRVGFEVEIISNSTALYRRIFPTPDEALAFAEEERKLRES